MVLENSEEDHQWAEYLWNYWNIGRKSTDCRIDKTGGKRPITHREGCGSGGGCSWRRQSQSRQAMLSHHSGGHLLAWENVPPNCWLKEAYSESECLLVQYTCAYVHWKDCQNTCLSMPTMTFQWVGCGWFSAFLCAPLCLPRFLHWVHVNIMVREQ